MRSVETKRDRSIENMSPTGSPNACNDAQLRLKLGVQEIQSRSLILEAGIYLLEPSRLSSRVYISRKWKLGAKDRNPTCTTSIMEVGVPPNVLAAMLNAYH